MTDSFLGGTYGACRAILEKRLREPAPGKIQLLTGPRQVGKTTLLLELAERLRPTALYAAADGPEAALPGFWERLWQRAEASAREHGSARVLVDEAHHLHRWAARLKGEWDRLRRQGLPVHVVATGSSALRLATGSSESLAGRFERIVLNHWTASALAAAFSFAPRKAAEILVRRGGYPGAVAFLEEPARWQAYVRDAIIEPAIGRDLLALGSIRRPALLRQLFAVCVDAPCQIVSLQKLQGRIRDPGALETITHYLRLLEEAYLVAALEKHSRAAVRRRAAPPKLLVLSNALLAATDPRGIPEPRSDPARFGAWIENACLAHAWNRGQRVTYWREEPFEVDAVIEGSWGRLAVEVKTGPFAEGELAGLLEFCRRERRYEPLVLTDETGLASARRAAVRAIPWREFLLAEEGP